MLVNISASSDFKMKEYHEVMSIINKYAADNAHVIVGNVIDDSMGNNIRVTMVATGLAYLKDEDKLNLSNDQNKNNDEIMTEFIYKPDAEVEEFNNETQEPIENKKVDNPSVFEPNTSDGIGLEGMAVSDEEEYDIPTYMRRKNK